MAAPPNNAPNPIAAVCAGAKALLVALDEAEDEALEAELVADDNADEALLSMLDSSDERELAADPVAVESSELILDRRLASAEVIEAK